MIQTVHVDAREPSIARLLGAYTGKEAKLRADIRDGEPFAFQGNYWSGGSKSEYRVADIVTGRTVSIPTNPDFPRFREQSAVIPAGCVVVERSVFCGKDMPPVIHARPGDLAAALPESIELSEANARCLCATASLKNTYGGETGIRQKHSGLTPDEWTTAQAECIARGWLRKNGSITRDGRNAIESHPLRNRIS